MKQQNLQKNFEFRIDSNTAGTSAETRSLKKFDRNFLMMVLLSIRLHHWIPLNLSYTPPEQ